MKGNPPLEFQTALPEGAGEESGRLISAATGRADEAKNGKEKRQRRYRCCLTVSHMVWLWGRGSHWGFPHSMLEVGMSAAQTRAHYLPVVGMCGSRGKQLCSAGSGKSGQLGQEKSADRRLSGYAVYGRRAGRGGRILGIA